MWRQLEPTETHLTLVIVPGFLIAYSLFSSFIRNRLQLAEPVFATLVGIIFGPVGVNVLRPASWGIGDQFTQEFTRIILGLQCFTIGAELPQGFFRSKWRSVAMLLGPVMAGGWLLCAVFIHLLFDTGIPTSLVISACLTPTDPVLAASILSGSRFAGRVPKRIREILSAESGSNDGASFPFLYVGLSILQGSSFVDVLRRYFLLTLLWQCVCGILLGGVLGTLASRLLQHSVRKGLIQPAPYVSYYFFLTLLAIGVASTLGLDDFLVAFTAGITFAMGDGSSPQPFAASSDSKMPSILDLQLNSAVFVYFGARIPWAAFNNGLSGEWPLLNPGRLLALIVLVLLFRRIPFVLLFKPLIPDFKTWTEALFAGHFGPMGVGALFLAIEARAQLETDTSSPLPRPPPFSDGDNENQQRKAVDLVWPVVCAVVLGSVLVHGLSTLFISIAGGVWQRKLEEHHGDAERTPLLGTMGEERFAGMAGDEEHDEEG